MIERCTRPGFPFAATLTYLSTLSAALTGLLLWVVPMLSADESAMQAVLLMALVAWGSVLMSVVPVVSCSATSLRVMVKAYFVGAAMRVALCLMAITLAVKALHLPAGPATFTLMTVYIPTMFLETALVVRHIKRTDFPVRRPAGEVPL